METLRDLDKRIESIQNTRQITKAMKMVAVARLAKAEKRVQEARPYAGEITRLIESLAVRGQIPPPFFGEAGAKPLGLVIITGDRGLCGAFNNNVLGRAEKMIQASQAESRAVHLFLLGRKGTEFFRRRDIPIALSEIDLFRDFSFHDAERLGKQLLDSFLEEMIGDVRFIFNRFISVLRHELVQTELLPIKPAEGKEVEETIDYLYEPGTEQILEGLLPRYVVTTLQHALLESYAAEMAARMTAMENATNSAEEMIEELTRYRNRVRQESITLEIMDIVAGTEALR